MDDLISRQALLDAFGLSEKTRKYGGDHSGYDTLMLYEIQDVVENIPSAEPQIVRVNPELSKEEFERLAKEIKDSPLVLLPSVEPQECKTGREEHIKALQEMRTMMLEDENWESMKRLIDAVTAGGMALQRLNMIDFGEDGGGA